MIPSDAVAANDLMRAATAADYDATHTDKRTLARTLFLI